MKIKRLVLIVGILSLLFAPDRISADSKDNSLYCTYESNGLEKFILRKKANDVFSVVAPEGSKEYFKLYYNSSSFFIDGSDCQLTCPTLYLYYIAYSTYAVYDKANNIAPYEPTEGLNYWVVTPSKKKGKSQIVNSNCDKELESSTYVCRYILHATGEEIEERVKSNRACNHYLDKSLLNPNPYNDDPNNENGPYLCKYISSTIGAPQETILHSFDSDCSDTTGYVHPSKDTNNDFEDAINPGDEVPEIILGDPLDCDSLKNMDTYKIISQIFKWLQIVAPIMLVIFGVIDFATAVAASDAEAIKKAQGKFVKRVIVVAIIILLPFIMDLLVSLLDGAMGNDVSTCNIGK